MTDLAEPPVRDLSDAHTDMPGLNGRKAIITSGTTSIGRAITVLLASEGVNVFVCGRDPQHLRDGLDCIREVGKGDGTNVDLAKPDGVDRFVKAAKNYSGDFGFVVGSCVSTTLSLVPLVMPLSSPVDGRPTAGACGMYRMPLPIR